MLSLDSSKRIVVKVGTNVLSSDAGGFSLARLHSLVEELIWLYKQNCDVFLVTSGAVGLGQEVLKKTGALSLVEKQACAAVGQSVLMKTYQDAFAHAGITVAQVLLTADDLANRQRYLTIKETFETLIGMRVIPIINENDCISVAELQPLGKGKSFGDNDMLSALLASKLDANTLIILSNVDGLYDKNPSEHADARKILEVDGFEALRDIDTAGTSSKGRGGMETKMKAAQLASLSNITTVIASGFEPQCIQKLFQDKGSITHATVVRPQGKLSSKKRWVAFASGHEGIITVNPCAVEVLEAKNVSLLPIGIVDVVGEFTAQSVVSIQDEHGRELGRGVSQFSAQDVRLMMGAHSSEIETRLGRAVEAGKDVVIQRDNLIIFKNLLLT